MLSDLLEKITSKETLEAFKVEAAKEIKAFSKRANPFKGIKASNYYIYIDTKSLSYGIILQGVKPNAGAVKGFSAPVNKFEKIKPYKVQLSYGWRTLSKERATSGSTGNSTLSTHYYGISGKPASFFGLKKKGKTRAFGIVENEAVPIYSDTGFVEWITEEQASELERLLEQAGFTAIEKQ